MAQIIVSATQSSALDHLAGSETGSTAVQVVLLLPAITSRKLSWGTVALHHGIYAVEFLDSPFGPQLHDGSKGKCLEA